MNDYPELCLDVQITPQPDGRFLLARPDSSAAVRLGPLELRLVTALDGQTPPTELARLATLLTGRALPPEKLQALIQRLAALDLVRLPVLPAIHWLPEDRAHCVGCGNCCHLAVGPLEPFEVQRLLSLPWATTGEAPPPDWLVDEHGVGCTPAELAAAGPEPGERALFLRQRADSACCFLEADNRCQLHRLFGFDAKPVICRTFSLYAVRLPGELRVAAAPSCPGQAAATAAQTVAREAATLGELLYLSRLQAPRLTLHGERRARGPGRADARGPTLGDAPDPLAAFEAELLAGLADQGPDGAGALGRMLGRVAQAGRPGLGPGESAAALLAALARHCTAQLTEELPAFARAQVAELVRLLDAARRTGLTPVTALRPLDPEADGLLRRTLRGLLFTRFHLFRFGLAAGAALLGLLTLLAHQEASRQAAARGGPEVTPAEAAAGIRAVFLAAQALGDVEEFPGIGTRCLAELAELLAGETTA
ncbi:MAG: hypothetical protein RBU45_05110 [Myxococcota bacterium]|jgi:Fe-S-cluster containining protein|nr:hypothetical protein [Myxococcota bacterium]